MARNVPCARRGRLPAQLLVVLSRQSIYVRLAIRSSKDVHFQLRLSLRCEAAQSRKYKLIRL